MSNGRDHERHIHQPALGGWHLTEWAAEAAGTALLVLGGLSAVALNFGRGSPVAGLIPSPSLRLLLTGLLFAGTGSLVAISWLGRRSGGHINPAVTLAFWCIGHVHPHDLAGYTTSQLLGGFVGAALFRLLWGPVAESVGGGLTLPGEDVGPLAAVVTEALMTAILVMTILFFVSSSRTARWTPLAVWIVVALLVWRGARYTGTSLNPARSLGPALVQTHLESLWIYFVGPPLGALAAVGLWVVARRERRVLTAKLFHDPRHPSVFRTHLPAKPRSSASH